MRLHKDGAPIVSVDDWKRLAPPKAEYQWVPGRSAHELANAWCRGASPTVPTELVRLFESNPAMRGLVVDEAIPEHRIRFDGHGGEPRNADLVLVGHTSSSKVAVTIEAKADEPFGTTVRDALADALERSIENPRSQGVQRVNYLVRALLPPRRKGLPHVGDLRYQLLTAAAGTLAYAAKESASLAVLIVHEFMTDKTRDKRHIENGEDFRRFLHRLGGEEVLSGVSDALLGPFAVPSSSPFHGATFLIGKIVSNCRSRESP
jgi:hypothetical protein